MAPFRCLNYFQVLATRIRHTQEFKSTPISEPRLLETKLVVHLQGSRKNRQQNPFLSQPSQLQSCTFLRIRNGIVILVGETHERVRPCRNLFLFGLDCVLALFFRLPVLVRAFQLKRFLNSLSAGDWSVVCIND